MGSSRIWYASLGFQDGSLTKQPKCLRRKLDVLVGLENSTKVLRILAYKPKTNRKTGQIISRLVRKVELQKQNIQYLTLQRLITGHIIVACVAIREKLNLAFLWSECRYHIAEVILSRLLTDQKIEVYKSPDISLFIRFQKK